MDKINVAPFNSLPFDERRKIAYYTNEEKILTIRQVISMLDDSIGQYQKRKLREWLKNVEKYGHDNWALQEPSQREEGQDENKAHNSAQHTNYQSLCALARHH